jgi:phosphate-selective porin OprO/OprP
MPVRLLWTILVLGFAVFAVADDGAIPPESRIVPTAAAASDIATENDGTLLSVEQATPATPIAIDSLPLPSESESSAESELEARVRELEAKFNGLQAADKKKKLADSLKPTLKWSGELQADAAWFQQSPLNRETVGDAQDAFGFRRARIAALGEFMENVTYRMEYDFAQAGRPSFLDNWVNFQTGTRLGNVKVGHFFEPFSLERLTSNRYGTFMERSLPDLFAPARNLGVSAYDTAANEQMTWAIGAFRTMSDNFGNDFGDNGGWSGTGRVTWLPWYDEESDGACLLHLAAAYSYRSITERTVAFREPPEIRVSSLGVGDIPPFVNTGNIPARSFQLFGTEAALVYGPWSVQSEYMYVPVDRLNGPNVHFQAMYLYTSFFVTGEHRQYRRSTATFDRISPKTYVLKPPGDAGPPKGWGAWELAARWSYINLTDRDIPGGRLNDITFGVNWYLNPYTRFMWNYIHPILDKPGFGTSTADVFAMRMQFDF